nr:Flp pilus assembly complex ATPase component TadA [bacterium]
MTDIISKLKESINSELINKFDPQILEQMRFVPINIKEHCIYIAINPFANKDEIADLIKNSNSDFETKFVQLAEDEIEELLTDVLKRKHGKKNDSDEEDKNSSNQELDEGNGHHKKPKRIGELLKEEGLITDIQLVKALAESKRLGMPLGSVLYKLGYVTLKDLKRTLHKQQGYDFVSADQLKVKEKVVNILPEDFIKTNKVIPISSDGKSLVVGMVNPGDTKVLKDIVYLTGQKPRAMLITYFEFQNIINSIYSHSKKETKEIIQKIEEEAVSIDNEETLFEQVERELQDSTGSVAKFVNKIITDGIDTKASDIHIEPRLNNYVVRYRTDGILKLVMEIPSKVEQSVLTRFKVLSRMNIAEHRRPQDGTFSIKYKDQSYDFRINTLPVSGKEKVVIRILAPAVSLAANDKEIN